MSLLGAPLRVCPFKILLHPILLSTLLVQPACGDSKRQDTRRDQNVEAEDADEPGRVCKSSDAGCEDQSPPPQNGSFEKIKVTFTGTKGDQVPAYLFIPYEEGPHPAVLLQYGLGSTKESTLVTQVAEFLARHGYLTMTIDVPGRGERVSYNGSLDNILTVLDHDLFRWYMGDYRKAVDYLTTLDDVDENQIGYVGASWGAITGIPFVANDLRVKTMVSVVGGGGFFGVIPPDLDPANTIGDIAPRPVYLINAKNDQIILPNFAQTLHDNAGANTKTLWLDTDHTLTGVDFTALLGDILGFLSKAL